jgi:hypothetical protein
LKLISSELSILTHLAAQGGTGNVMDALSFDATQFDEAFTLALGMENKDLVKLLYSNFNKKLIVVELTLLGYNAIR